MASKGTSARLERSWRPFSSYTVIFMLLIKHPYICTSGIMTGLLELIQACTEMLLDLQPTDGWQTLLVGLFPGEVRCSYKFLGCAELFLTHLPPVPVVSVYVSVTGPGKNNFASLLLAVRERIPCLLLQIIMQHCLEFEGVQVLLTWGSDMSVVWRTSQYRYKSACRPGAKARWGVRRDVQDWG